MERNEGMARCKAVDVQELEHAELQIIKIILNEAFLNEIQMLKDTKTKLQATNKDPTNERTKTTEPYHLRVALGADGAPFGKYDEATSWLVSFVNVGQQIASETDNFILAGANCSESHLSMQHYARKLVSDVGDIDCHRL